MGGSSDHILVSLHKKRLQRQGEQQAGRCEVYRAKVHTEGGECGLSESEHERRAKMAGYELSVLPGGRAQENVLTRPLVSSYARELGFPLFLPRVALPELSWRQVHDGSRGLCDADEIILMSKVMPWPKMASRPDKSGFGLCPLPGLKQRSSKKGKCPEAIFWRGQGRSWATCRAST